MVKYRSHSIAFKRQVAEEFLGGETLHGLAKTHDVTRNLIRIWVAKYEAGEFEADVEAADHLQEYEAKIAALERMVGRLTMELDFLRGVSRSRRSAIGGTTSIVTGPTASPSREDASS